jgi:hypothetical protein
MTATTSERATPLGDRLDGWHLDAVVSVLATLMVAGVALDFRSHAAGISFAEEGFLTPEHAFFYSMFIGIAAVVGVKTVDRRWAGHSWIEAVPPGYGAGALGILLFGFGGVGDVLWHSAFGFEADVEALISPSHLLLATGAVTFLSSPARAAWRRESIDGGWRTLPAVVSLGLALAVVALFLLFVNPIAQPFAGFDVEGNDVSLGVAGFVVFPTVVLGAMLALARRFDLPPGALTLFALLPGVASAVPLGYFALIAPAIAMGVVADVLARIARPATEHSLALRTFGIVVPLAFAASYMVTIELLYSIAWTVHVWVGAVVYAGLAGLGLTYVISPTGHWSEP